MISAADKRRYKAIASWLSIVGLLVINAGLLVMLIRGRAPAPGPGPNPPPIVDVRPEVVAAANAAIKRRAAILSEGYEQLAKRSSEYATAQQAAEVADSVVAAADKESQAEISKVTAGLPDGDLDFKGREEIARFFRSLSVGFGEAAK
jgi:hypothetical protein